MSKFGSLLSKITETHYQDFIAAGGKDSDWDAYAAEINRKSREKAQAQLKADVDAERAKATSPSLDAFLSKFNPMSAGKMRGALSSKVSINGKFAPRFKHAEQMVADGYVVKGDRLQSPSGSFLTMRDVSKAMLDYAAYLVGKK